MDEPSAEIKEIVELLSKIPGGYVYSGACSLQWCFPLRSGGELRFMYSDDNYPKLNVDFYDGSLPPGITGPASPTGPTGDK